jgi:nicotinamidase-related amidase
MLSSTLTEPARRAGHRPWLICLDLQRHYVVTGHDDYRAEAQEVVRRCAKVLDLARASDWRVVHSQLRRACDVSRRRDYFGAPIEGLRPLISEAVYLRDGLSAFSNRDFAAKLAEAIGDEVFLIGFSLADTCLATVLAAVDHGLCLTLVEDAIGVGATGGRTPEQIARGLLTPFVRLASSGELQRSALELAI